MNGSKSPVADSRSGGSGEAQQPAPAATNGRKSPRTRGNTKGSTSPVPSIEGDEGNVDRATVKQTAGESTAANGADEDAASEAETLIDSPVKRKEAAKKQASSLTVSARSERPPRTRIGSLPVPHDDDDDVASAASPMQSTEVGTSSRVPLSDEAKNEDVEMHDEEEDAEGSDDDLSSAHSSARASPESSRSRAVSENPDDSNSRKNGSQSNPRKRKHRASSVDHLLSSKRRSMDPPARRRLRGMHSEDPVSKGERSPSPKLRGHRRAISTQSLLDGAVDGDGRRRRGSHAPAREPRSARTYEESDASSETTTRGQDEYKRAPRGIGRSTSTPGGRNVGREHKRHVNKYGFTRLAEACEDGDMDLVKELWEKDPDALEVAEFAGNKPLQIAALNGNAEVVAYLIEHGAQTDCANVDKDTPLIDAAENGHLEVIKLLLDAGVDPLRQNLKGQQALDVITDDTEDATAIRVALHGAIEDWSSNSAKRRREVEEETRHSHPQRTASKELHFMARTYENLLKLVQNNNRTGVQEFLAARVPVDNSVIAAAAKTGDVYLVNMLLAEMSEKKLLQKAEKPMLAVLGSSHFEMVKVLTELEWFNPLWKDRRGKGWIELVEERNGPMWRQEKELLRGLYDEAGGNKERRSSSPVSKRDTGSRRKMVQHRLEEGDDSEDDDGEDGPMAGGKVRSKRRLMNRRDLRTARGSATGFEEGSEERSSEEDAPGEPDDDEPDQVVKEPETPKLGTRRQLRTQSQAGSPEVSPRSLRKNRSSSFRSNQAMPTLAEEDHEAGGSSAVGEMARKNRQDEATAALASAREADEKRKADEAAEAEAKQAQEIVERKAAEEKRAEEARVAEEAREEEKKRKEQERKAEERLQREFEREREKEEKKRTYRSEVLAALPKSVAKALDPASASLLLNDVEKSRLVQHFTPLRVLVSNETQPLQQQQHWVLNLQVAPLLGHSGLQLFYGSDYPDYEQCLTSLWTTAELAPSDWLEVERFLAQLPAHPAKGSAQDEDQLTFDEELQRTADRYAAFVEAKKILSGPGCRAKLRRVRLEDVFDNLQPLCKDLKLEVEFVGISARQREQAMKQLEIQDTQDFVGRMKAFWEEMRVSRAMSSVEDQDGLSSSEGRWLGVKATDVVVVHEK